MKTKICACGAEIVFGLGPKGNLIPLVPAQHIYQLAGERAVPVLGAYRNHYTDCPKANEFRKPRVAQGPDADHSRLTFGVLGRVLAEPPSLDVISSWTKEEKLDALEWAAREETYAKNGLERLPKPAFLESYR